jgi:tetratricopeptide (TPR) repeat protein
VSRASGNPLYAQEMVRAAREAGSFEAVPDSLEAAIAAQVDALDPEARRVLRYATVLGRSFWRGTLDALLAQEGMSLDAALLERLEGFLEPAEDDQLRFRVGLVRRTIYEGLAFRLRARLHRQAGQTLEQLASDPLAVAGTLAMHFSIAGDLERTWRYARQAAERAAQAYSNADAARLYQMALDAARKLPEISTTDRIQAWTDRGNVCRLAGLFDDALAAYREAYKLAGDDPVERAELLRLRALARDRAGAFVQALRELSSGARLLAGVDTPEAHKTNARLASFAAMIRFGQERYQDTLTQGLAAAEAARAAGQKDALAQALLAVGMAQLYTGAGGAEPMMEALRIYEELGDLSSEAMVRGNLGVIACYEGRWDEALSWFESDRAARLRAGNPVGAATAASNCGELYAKQGRLDEAEPLLRDAIRVMRASGFHDGAAYAEIQLGRALVGRGAARQADELLERVGAELTQFGRKSSALEAALVQSLARIQLGQATEALELIDRAAAAAGGATGLLAPPAAEARARGLAALGQYQAADACLIQGLAVARELGLNYEEGTLLWTRSELQNAAGRNPDPLEVERCAEIFRALGVRLAPSAR